MSDRPKNTAEVYPIRGKSGDHPAVREYRRKMDSITEGTMPALEALNARLDRALEKASTDPPSDDRREPEDDDRKEPSIPIDIVTPRR